MGVLGVTLFINVEHNHGGGINSHVVRAIRKKALTCGGTRKHINVQHNLGGCINRDVVRAIRLEGQATGG